MQFTVYICIVETTTKKGAAKGGKKDRSPVASAGKKGSPKAGGKKGKKGKHLFFLKVLFIAI
jgi:hypothetical protein